MSERAKRILIECTAIAGILTMIGAPAALAIWSGNPVFLLLWFAIAFVL